MSRYRWHLGEIVSPLPARVFIDHDLGGLELGTREEVSDLARLIAYAPDDDKLVRIITEGRYFDAAPGEEDREEKSAQAASQIRALLLGTDTALAPTTLTTPAGPPRWLIRDVWEAGTFPQLSGNSKAGKSVVCLEAIKTLVDPSHLFLGRFERGEIDADDLERGIVYVNTENPASAIEDALRPLETVPFERSDGTTGTARDLVTVYHLRETLGGPEIFDPRNPEKFEMWRRELLSCNECEGDDNWGPFAVIADNGTAVLRALGDSVQDHIGEWFESLRRLLAEIDTENGIGVAHATMDGKNALGGTISSAASDGEWTYSRRGTSGNAPRFFAISPRLGPVPPLGETRVTRDAEGRLQLVGGAKVTPASAGETEDDVSESESGGGYEAELLEQLRAAGAEGLTKTEITGRGRVGSLRRAALEKLLEAGVVASATEGRRERWRAIEFAADTVSECPVSEEELS